jgi:hypothetical protein
MAAEAEPALSRSGATVGEGSRIGGDHPFVVVGIPAHVTREFPPGAVSVGDHKIPEQSLSNCAKSLIAALGCRRFPAVLADPPWLFANQTGKIAPKHRRLRRYIKLVREEIAELPVAEIIEEPAHLYLWVPNALLPDGIQVLRAWGSTSRLR